MSSLDCPIGCFVSLQRPEGFGGGSAEAMYHGKPAVVTTYSGARDLSTEETANLVEYRVAAAHLDDYPCLDSGRKSLWAETAIGSAARRMRGLYDRRDTSTSLGERARSKIRLRYTPSNLAESYFSRLAELSMRLESGQDEGK